jgi:hypothetical protein
LLIGRVNLFLYQNLKDVENKSNQIIYFLTISYIFIIKKNFLIGDDFHEKYIVIIGCIILSEMSPWSSSLGLN